MLTSTKVCLFMFCKCMYTYLLSTSMYQKLGYIELVGRAAELSSVEARLLHQRRGTNDLNAMVILSSFNFSG